MHSTEFLPDGEGERVAWEEVPRPVWESIPSATCPEPIR